jgi:cellobiose dehydrogenase (acceptor)
MTMSQNLGRGSTSRGVLSIAGGLNMYVSTLPYLRTAGDLEAVIKGLENLQAAIATVPSIVWEVPAPGVNASDFVNSVSQLYFYTMHFTYNTGNGFRLTNWRF